MNPESGMRRGYKAAMGGSTDPPLLRRVAHQLGPGVAVALLIGLFLAFRTETSNPASTTHLIPAGSGAGQIRVYFTAPQAGMVSGSAGSPDLLLVEAIDQAQRSVDVAVYALNLESVAGALRKADQRGVSVRLVVESDNASEPEVQALLGEGVPIREDRRPGLMHHKFVVIDRAEVWTGSMNLTDGAVYHDDNNLVRIVSPGLAEDFTREFDEMFEEDRFGAMSLRDTPRGRLTVDGIPLEVFFSPDDGVAGRIMELIDRAETSLEFAAYSLTADSIADRMLAASARGVHVRGVMETSQSKGIGSEYENLRSADVEVRLDGNPFNMHHKFLIIDHEVVVTGSYNFTLSAEEHNDENLIVLHDPEIAGAYGDEFERIFDLATPPQ